MGEGGLDNGGEHGDFLWVELGDGLRSETEMERMGFSGCLLMDGRGSLKMVLGYAELRFRLPIE